MFAPRHPAEAPEVGVRTLDPLPRHPGRGIGGEERDRRGHPYALVWGEGFGGDAPRTLLASFPGIGVGFGAQSPVAVDPEGGAAGLRRPVDGQGGQELVLGEAALYVAVAVAPGAPLLYDPGRKPGRGVVEGVGGGLGLSPLDVGVGAFGFLAARTPL